MGVMVTAGVRVVAARPEVGDASGGVVGRIVVGVATWVAASERSVSELLGRRETMISPRPYRMDGAI